jgi:NRAMP (natural resistance-associated macrophage protein)-like metal ion transporter
MLRAGRGSSRPAFRKVGHVIASGVSFDSVVMLRRSPLVLLVGVLGPGLLAGLSDDDAPGITTYSILGADYGYELLWVLGVATLALILFHELGARMGVVTGQGLTGLMRERYGVRPAALGVLALLVANIGTTCAEFAGVATSLDLAGVSRYASVPVAAVAISALVLLGSFHRVEHVFLLMSTLLGTFIVAAFVTGPDWGAAVHGLLVPSVPATRAGLLAITATVGTTLAPWGLAFIQSYAADKKLSVADLRYERIDVVTGALMTGVVGFFVVVTCADTLHQQGTSITDAGDAASALEPLAGRFASVIFGAGLLGASILAASILPLATAYSVSEVFGQEAKLDDPIREAPVFYGTFAVVIVTASALVLVPGAPLVPILYLSQALNAILLLPILAFIVGITRDQALMGEHASGRIGTGLAVVAIVLLALCVGALGALSIS